MPPKLQQRLLRSAVQRKKERDVHKALYQGERKRQGERGENIRDRACIDHIAADISKQKVGRRAAISNLRGSRGLLDRRKASKSRLPGYA